ncbi:hypothetical protein GCM10008933_18550 [Paenibacillus motobuensis]|uniref:Uncharacterized protein n=1 Tax=Paenibacillus motobuensis TaxID=295324 RepID=A0ABP3I2K9_9BACL
MNQQVTIHPLFVQPIALLLYKTFSRIEMHFIAIIVKHPFFASVA